MHTKQFLSPADVARELDISTSTVLRLIHSGDLPAIAVSARIYRIPTASFEMYKAGTLTRPTTAPLGGSKARPEIGRGERLPAAAHRPLARAR
ncbi:MAG: helix-turn-helix domain-containing protein [Chloroflexota bacterium]